MKIKEQFDHAADDDYWANGCDCFAEMLNTMQPTADDQRECAALFWNRWEKVVRVLFEESNRQGIQTAIERVLRPRFPADVESCRLPG
jgi:hypothetical protein